MRYLFLTGSREYVGDPATVPGFTAAIERSNVVVHGNCRGWDTAGWQYARDWSSCTHMPIPAVWTNGRQAGPARNELMAQLADKLRWLGHDVVVFAVLVKGLPNRGTRNAIAAFNRLDVLVTVVEVEP